MNLKVLQPYLVSLLFLLLIIVNSITIVIFQRNDNIIQYATVFSLAAFTFLLLVALKRNYLAFLYLLPFIILHWWALLSVAYIETGAYITEQAEFGKRTGACLRLIVQNSAFLATTFLISTKRYEGFVSYSQSIFVNKLFNIVLLGSCLTLLLGFVLFGAIPLFQSNRFEYFSTVPGIIKKVFLAHGMLAFIAGLLYGKGKDKRTLTLFLVYILLVVLSGDKFSAIFWSILAFYAGQKIATYQSDASINLKKIFFFFSKIFLVLLIIATLGFYYMHEIDDNLAVAILDRALGLQGHVWYGTDQLFENGVLGRLSLSNFFVETTPISPKGIDFLMYEVSDTSFANAMLEMGITFTMGFPAILLVYFQDYSIIICSLMGLLFGLVVRWNINSSLKFRVIDSILLYGIYFILIDVFTMGRFWELISIKMFVFVTLCLFTNFLRKVINGKKAAIQ